MLSPRFHVRLSILYASSPRYAASDFILPLRYRSVVQPATHSLSSLLFFCLKSISRFLVSHKSLSSLRLPYGRTLTSTSSRLKAASDISTRNSSSLSSHHLASLSNLLTDSTALYSLPGLKALIALISSYCTGSRPSTTNAAWIRILSPSLTFERTYCGLSSSVCYSISLVSHQSSTLEQFLSITLCLPPSIRSQSLISLSQSYLPVVYRRVRDG